MRPHIKSLNLRVLDLKSPWIWEYWTWKVLEFEVNQSVGTLAKSKGSNINSKLYSVIYASVSSSEIWYECACVCSDNTSTEESSEEEEAHEEEEERDSGSDLITYIHLLIISVGCNCN